MSDRTSTQSKPDGPVWERWLPRVSSGAAFITTLCCLGISALLSLATSIGATFLTRDSSLRPILAVTLLLTVAASALTFRRHRNPLPLILTVAAGVLVFWTLFGGGSGHAATTDHGAGASASEHAAPTSEHADEHATTGEHAATGEHSDEHATAPADEHAAAPGGEHADGMDDHAAGGHHGGQSTTDKVLVWLGLAVLVGAQVWDLLILRARRRTEALAA